MTHYLVVDESDYDRSDLLFFTNHRETARQHARSVVRGHDDGWALGGVQVYALNVGEAPQTIEWRQEEDYIWRRRVDARDRKRAERARRKYEAEKAAWVAEHPGEPLPFRFFDVNTSISTVMVQSAYSPD